MATNENLGSHKMLYREDEVELVMEESSIMDNYEMENEVTELELDNNKGIRMVLLKVRSKEILRQVVQIL